MIKILIASFFLLSGVAVADTNAYSVESAIYKIEMHTPEGVYAATGVLISQNKILTNCHVAKKSGWPQAVHRKTGQVFRVTQYTELGKMDACILGGVFIGTPIDLASGYEIGDPVWHYGYPRGISVVGQGNIVRRITITTNYSTEDAIQSAAFCNPGSSGGPLLNAKGQLVGLNFATQNARSNMCVSIPIERLRPYLN